MRIVRIFILKWKYLFTTCMVVCLMVLYLPTHQNDRSQSSNGEMLELKKVLDNTKVTRQSESHEELSNNESHAFKFTSAIGSPFFVERLLTYSEISLRERLTCQADKNASPKLILVWDSNHSQENLGGCLDWNCEIVHDKQKLDLADAVLIAHSYQGFSRTNSEQYVIYFSQESPAHSDFYVFQPDFFNFSLGFRHDTPASSPYGYTVKLAHESTLSGEVIDLATIDRKKKGAAWFVSNCITYSMRENYVNELKKYFPVDIYGKCGSFECIRGGECEKMLDEDYHFYVAFENSVCKDYITEKLWNQGYQRSIVPIVLKRSIVERFVPPHSFIAADDFKSPKDLAVYLHYLMNNKTAYAEFFSWRRQYKVVFLDGKFHDNLERPWGFCQICRLLWEKPRPRLSITDFADWWRNSCERKGTLVNELIRLDSASKTNFPEVGLTV
ncbi:hypothetical protein KIN20_001282 [Parelaphostrongylus tenuis]|uniref:Fucosyltransferase n=1 Tax=Parelaphostrongylus tenuis TaxID=148309 RepID=A0AAD5MCM7_PARTN|nr:hypothetical protein KIN20_001282 [Parelaphostrongylus tenuis]